MASIAKYSFLSTAKSFVADVKLDEVSHDDLEAASQRILDSVNRQTPSILPNQDVRSALSAYILSRILLSALGSQSYLKKFAHGESLIAIAHLKNEGEREFMEVAKDFFPSASAPSGGQTISISLKDFLSFGHNLSSKPLEKGMLSFTQSEFQLLLSDAIEQRIMDVKSFNSNSLPKFLQEQAEELRSRLPSVLPAINAYSGSFLSTACVQKILAGVAEGKRYYGSFVLASACYSDKLDLNAAKKVMEQYVANSRKSAHEFTIGEAMATLNWVYKKGVKFSCNYSRNHAFADYDSDCRPCPVEVQKNIRKRQDKLAARTIM